MSTRQQYPERNLLDIDLEQYRGQRGALERDLGELGLLLLHRYCRGNLRAAVEFLGYSGNSSAKRTVSAKWAALGLLPLGREYPRRGGEFHPWPRWTLEEWRRRYQQISAEEERALVYRWRLPQEAETGVLVAISDLHVGHIACDYKRFLELRDWIAERPQVRWFLGGDNLDTQTSQSPGSSRDQFCPLDVALDLLTEDLQPIRRQGIAVFDGNHEGRLERHLDLQFSPSEELARRLDLPYMGRCGHIVHRLGKRTYTHYHHHGRGAARTDGAKLNTGEAIAATVTDELVTVGHLHVELQAKLLRRQVQRDATVVNQTQRLVMLPSFLRYRGYPAEQALRPSALGVSTIELGVAEHDVHVVE